MSVFPSFRFHLSSLLIANVFTWPCFHFLSSSYPSFLSPHFFFFFLRASVAPRCSAFNDATGVRFVRLAAGSRQEVKEANQEIGARKSRAPVLSIENRLFFFFAFFFVFFCMTRFMCNTHLYSGAPTLAIHIKEAHIIVHESDVGRLTAGCHTLLCTISRLDAFELCCHGCSFYIFLFLDTKEQRSQKMALILCPPSLPRFPLSC